MANALNHLINGELELFKQSVNANLYSKVSDALAERKKELASDLFSEEECSSCGEQIDEEEKVPGPVVARRLAGGMSQKEAHSKPVGIRGKKKGHG